MTMVGLSNSSVVRIGVMGVVIWLLLLYAALIKSSSSWGGTMGSSPCTLSTKSAVSPSFWYACAMRSVPEGNAGSVSMYSAPMR